MSGRLKLGKETLALIDGHWDDKVENLHVNIIFISVSTFMVENLHFKIIFIFIETLMAAGDDKGQEDRCGGVSLAGRDQPSFA